MNHVQVKKPRKKRSTSAHQRVDKSRGEGGGGADRGGLERSESVDLVSSTIVAAGEECDSEDSEPKSRGQVQVAFKQEAEWTSTESRGAIHQFLRIILNSDS
jgi:hypothetical protein